MNQVERVASVLLAIVVAIGLTAGVLSLNRTADLAIASVANIGNAERDAAYARAKADDMVRDYADRLKEVDREARLAEYYAIDLKEYMAEHGLHPPPDPWSKPKKERKK